VNYRKSPIFIGIGAVVAIALITAAIDPTGRLAADVTAPAAVLLFLGILLYQWRWAKREETAPIGTGAKLSTASDLGQVTDQYDMYVALAIRPVSMEEMRKARSGVFGMVRANIKLGLVLAILPAGAAVMIITGWVPDVGNGNFMPIVPLILAPLGFAWVRWTMAGAAESGNSLLEPMGLAMTAMPQVGVRRGFGPGQDLQTDIRGATEVEGERHGRQVHVTLGGKHATEVSGAYPEFEIGHRGQSLQVKDGAPAAIEQLIGSLGPSPHWKSFKSLKAGADGMVATRGVDAEGGWLWDLWLCELLADATSKGWK